MGVTSVIVTNLIVFLGCCFDRKQLLLFVADLIASVWQMLLPLFDCVFDWLMLLPMICG